MDLPKQSFGEASAACVCGNTSRVWQLLSGLCVDTCVGWTVNEMQVWLGWASGTNAESWLMEHQVMVYGMPSHG